MTKEQFKEKYPNGLNIEAVAFQKALYLVMTTKEIDRVINQAKGKEKMWLKDFKKSYLKLTEDWDTNHWQILLHNIESKVLLQDVIAIMISLEKSVYNGENEE